jgi:translocator protein
MTVNKDALRQGVNVVVFIAVIVVNALANILPINGQTTGELADRYPVWIQPAGYAFSIWTVIYIALAAFTAYQAVPTQRENPRLRRIGSLFALTGAANIAWILLWHYELVPLSLVAMFALLGALIAIYLRLDPVRERLPVVERWVVALPFSLYLGWITVASLVNVAVVVYDQNLSAWNASPEAWTLGLLALTAAVAAVIGLLRADVGFILVIVWASIAIVVNNGGRPLVATSAALVALLALLTLGLGTFRAREQGRHVAP